MNFEGNSKRGRNERIKFVFSNAFQIDTTVEPWKREGLRVGVFAGSGSGKSYTTAAVFIEQCLEQKGTVVIFQPRAEWHTIKAKFPEVQVVGGSYLRDVDLVTSQPKLYAEAIVKQGISMIFTTGDVEDEEKLINFVRGFVSHLLKLEELIHRPILFVLEESQEFAPNSPKGHVAAPWVFNQMIKVLKDCFTQGRKLGINPIAISQRPQEVSFTIRQLANLSLYGKFAPQDISYVDRECLKPYRDKGIKVHAEKLLDLKPGQWLVIEGSRAEFETVTVKRKTPHGAETPDLDFVPKASEQTKKTVSSLQQMIEEELRKQTEEESELEKLKRQLKSRDEKIEEVTKQLEFAKNLRSLLSAEGSSAALEKAEKRIFELENELSSETTRRKQAEESSYQAKELQTQNEKLQSELGSYYDLKRALSNFMSGSSPAVPPTISIEGSSISSPSSSPKKEILDRTVRANIDRIIQGVYTPEHGKKILTVLRESPRGSVYSKAVLCSAAKISPESSSTHTALSWLKRNKLIESTKDGIKLAGE